MMPECTDDKPDRLQMAQTVKEKPRGHGGT